MRDTHLNGLVLVMLTPVHAATQHQQSPTEKERERPEIERPDRP